MFTKTCLICGKKFQSKAHNTKHCSRACRLEAKRRRWAASHGPRKIYNRTCVVCGKSFETKLAVQKYCSSKCYKLAWVNKKRSEGKKHRKQRSKKTLSKEVFMGLCSVCGDEDVPVFECTECGYLSCARCRNDLGVCKICSGILLQEVGHVDAGLGLRGEALNNRFHS